MKYRLQSFGKLAFTLLLTINFSFLTFHCVAQAPQSFSYQAVVRDAQGNIVQNQSVAFRFSILENSTTGNVVYAETQTTTTNNLGLVVLAIGNGTVLQGTFSTIQWGNASHFLKVELDVTGSTNYVDMGTTQLLSVPYALYSQNAGNVQTYTPGNGISITGNVIENTAPNQPVSLTGQGATTVSGTYPNFTISSTDSNTTYTAGAGINITGTTIANTAPNQPVSLTGHGATTVSGTYPDFTISSTDSNTTYTAGAGLTLTGTEFSHIAHSGDVSGTTSLTVTGIQGKPVSTTAPVANQVLKFDGTNWSPTQPSNLINAGNGLNYSGNTLNSLWTQNGNNIFNNNAGRVGIGMSAPTGKLSIQGDTSNVLFEVKDKNGYSVFVVYQDSVQVFVDATGAKTNKGSFAVNPKGQQKAVTTNYLRVTPDSSRIYTQDTLAGFGVRNLGPSGNLRTSYMQLTPNNYFIGHLGGVHIAPNQSNGDGLYNCTYGYEAGMNLTLGYNNVLIGYKSGLEQTSGWSNVAIGSESGRYANTTYTTFLGTCSGSYANGDDNVYVGYNAGKLTSANDNFNSVFIGSETGKNTFGSQNTIVGSGAGFCYYTTPYERDNNIFIGANAGFKTSVGGLDNNNIIIGNSAGYASGLTGSDQLYIENSSDVTNPLIQGDFVNNRIAFHRKATTYPLQVGTSSSNGNAAYLTAGGTWTNTSSKSYKDRFQQLDKNDILSKIEHLDVESWYYKETQERHIGPVAEDFYQAFGTGVLDEPVYLGKSLAASDVAGVSLFAVKELIIKNKLQQSQIDELTKKIEQLENKINQLSNSSASSLTNSNR